MTIILANKYEKGLVLQGLRLIFFALFFRAAFAIELQIDGTCRDLKYFSDAQNEVLLYAYYYGQDFDNKDFVIKDSGLKDSINLGYYLAAIAWKESCAGEYLLNFSDPSAGIYHAHLPSVIKRYTKYKDTPFIRNVVAQMLISDARLSSAIALDSLKYWLKLHKGNLQNAIKSYNKGFSWKTNPASNRFAQNYYNDIERKVKKLQGYLPALLLHRQLHEPKLKVQY